MKQDIEKQEELVKNKQRFDKKKNKENKEIEAA